MKKIAVLLLSGALLTLTGCLDVVEELYLNRDGSGKYNLTFDMSGLFTDPFMKGMMDQAMEEGGMKDDGAMEMDTVVYFKDAPDSVRQQLDRPEFWDKVVMRMTMSESRQKMVASFELDFEELSDIDYFYKNLDKFGEGSAVGDGMMSGSFLTSGALFSLKGKKLTRRPAEQSNTEELDEESMEFVKMFLADASYKTIYHLPGKVKKSSIPGSVKKGDTVTVTTPYLDLMDGKANIVGDIVFK